MQNYTGSKEQKDFELKRLFNLRQDCVKRGLFEAAEKYGVEYVNLRDRNLVGQPE